MITEAIVLAGGLGTRLRAAVPDLPKCMAPVAGEPFLAHVIRYYHQQGITRFVFSLGYKHEMIESYLQQQFTGMSYTCEIEDEPLGTGGAILKSSQAAQSPDVLILNGDTLFAVNVRELSDYHLEKKSDCTLSLKTMFNSDRYGVVQTDEDGRIISFHEKKFYPESTINGGVYALKLSALNSISTGAVFSFEKEFLERHYQHLRMFGLKQDGYFIDIGIPEDYERAQVELKSDKK